MNPVMNLTTAPEAFESCYRPHLDRVSRSFALCIRELQEPLRSWTGIAYLICRLLDTVEDAPWGAPSTQRHAFDTLDAFMVQPPKPDSAAAWAALFPQDIPEGERLLLKDCHRILTDLHALPGKASVAIRTIAQRMSAGMRYYAQTWAHTGSLALVDLEDVNRYCYFVAGVVGELLTQLFTLSWGAFVPEPSLWLDAHHFGLFLQKVNLLKDQKKDEREQRFLCPNRDALLNSLPLHAEGALRYLTALPEDARAFRIFCAWSMFLGAASMPFIEADHREAQTHKISREQTQSLMQDIAAMACDNAALTRSMHAAMELMPKGRQPHKSADCALELGPQESRTQRARRAWFATLDHGPLGRVALATLGMAPSPS